MAGKVAPKMEEAGIQTFLAILRSKAEALVVVLVKILKVKMANPDNKKLPKTVKSYYR